LFIVSNCQAGYIEIFLRHSGLGALFTDFECWGNSGRPKADNLRSVVERNRLRAPWFIGDTSGDQEAARACGVPFVFAAYGFGTCRAPEATIESLPALRAAVAGARRGAPGEDGPRRARRAGAVLIRTAPAISLQRSAVSSARTTKNRS
jgi:hypothetical protein